MTIGELRTLTLIKYIDDSGFTFELLKKLENHKKIGKQEPYGYIVVPVYLEGKETIKKKKTKKKGKKK